MRDDQEDRKEKRKKMNKIEIFVFGFLNLVKGHSTLAKVIWIYTYFKGVNEVWKRIGCFYT